MRGGRQRGKDEGRRRGGDQRKVGGLKTKREEEGSGGKRRRGTRAGGGEEKRRGRGQTETRLTRHIGCVFGQSVRDCETAIQVGLKPDKA